jgi:hypothetical protein
MTQFKTLVEPDATGLGRIIYNGRYYGVPSPVIEAIERAHEYISTCQLEGKLPVQYYKEGGVTYAVYGSSSIDYVEYLRQQLAHEKWLREQAENFCVAVQDQRDECQAKEKLKNDTLVAVQMAICLAADDAPDSAIGKLYNKISEVIE